MTESVGIDIHGHYGEYSLMRDLRVALPYRLVGTSFVGTTVDANFWTSAVSGTGAAYAQASNDATLTSGTSNNGYSTLSTAQVARFAFAHPHVWRGAIRLASTTATLAKRRFGAYTVSGSTPQNGFYFEVSAAGALSVNRVNATSVTTVASGSFNGNVTSYTLDTNLHAYEIHYFMMQVEFLIDNVVIHTFTPTTGNLVADFNLPAAATSVNDASGTTSATLDVHSMVVIRLGRESTAPRSQYQSGTTAGLVLKRGPGIIHAIAISAVAVNSAITLYDNTAASGTVLWASGSMGANTTPFSIGLHDIPFFTGLTLLIATAAADATVIYE
jgi:hypothetical protein